MKTEEDEILEFDDDEAMKFILKMVPKEMKKRINENSINYVLDVIYDFYEDKGLIDNDTTDEANIDEEEMLDYVVKAAKKDNIELNEDEIQFILDGEYEYGKSIGIYSDEDEN
jgi:archaellum component FlaG (FlaF/FlaG flagellin family)